MLDSLLTVKKITDKKYEHVLKVWKKFEMKTMKNYHNLHSKYHVLLLAYVFEKFRNRRSKSYGICLSQHLRAPALSWDAMLNMTKVKLEPISIGEMFLFFLKRYDRWSLLYF